MTISRSVSKGLIVTGCSLLVLTLISIICGGVVMSKVTIPAAIYSVGLWGFYFAFPGVFCILAGVKKETSLLAVALGTNILGFMVANLGLFAGAVFWTELTSCVYKRYCLYDHKDIISDLKTVHNSNGAVTIVFAFFAVVTFIGSIYGCLGTCCAQRSDEMVTTAQPNTMAMTTQSYPADSRQPLLHDDSQAVVDT